MASSRIVISFLEIITMSGLAVEMLILVGTVRRWGVRHVGWEGQHRVCLESWISG